MYILLSNRAAQGSADDETLTEDNVGSQFTQYQQKGIDKQNKYRTAHEIYTEAQAKKAERERLQRVRLEKEKIRE